MMKKYLFLSVCAVLTFKTKAQNGSFDEKARAYVQQYAAWAIEEQKRVGIPAAITLAQGIHETSAGASELATEANNHFGIKCKKDWRGETFAHTDDAPNECFRKYADAKSSYIDHSDYLKNSVRYAELFEYAPTNYHAWAKGLKKCGYATSPVYAQKLIKMVEDYDLQQYTLQALEPDVVKPVAIKKDQKEQQDFTSNNLKQKQTDDANEASSPFVYVNNIKSVYCKKGSSLLEIALKHNLRYEKLLEINELEDAPTPRDMYVYLAPKNSKGAHLTHIVAPNETLEIIAHNEGMSTRQLRVFNLIAQNEQAAEGAVLQLQQQSETRPDTYKFSKVKSEENQGVRFTLQPAGNAKVQDNDYLPTKKANSNQAQEEVEFGYGAERPKELEFVKNAQPAKIQEQVQQKNEFVQTIPNSSETGNSNKPEIKETTNTEPLDEIALLKARLDRAVYSKSSKSNVKVQSSDSVMVQMPKQTSQIVAASKAKTTNTNEQYHIVDKGDTAYSIAKKYGIKVKQLNEWNNLNFNGIKIGQKLRVQ